MNAFEAAEQNGRAADLQKELKICSTAKTEARVRMLHAFRQPSCVLRSHFEKVAHRGGPMGIPASGRTVRFTVHARNRLVGRLMAEHGDTADFEDLLRQIRAE